jgi:D-alanyl-D-alanine carboxypeptidase (penicillin-binding protein 5/6)
VALLLFSLVLALLLLIPVSEREVEAVAVLPKEKVNAYANITLSAKAAIVYDLVTKEVLYASNADTQLPLASLTKLLILHAALAKQSLDTPITIAKEDFESGVPKRFKEGDTFALANLARVTLVGALPEGAAALARTTAEKEGVATDTLLANAASGLGLTTTYALKSSGLDVSETTSGGYGSARDMAILAGSLVETAPDVALETIFPKVIASTDRGEAYEIFNTNTLLKTVPRLLLSSTAYTDLTQNNMALVFDAGMGHPIALIILGAAAEAEGRETEALLDATFAHFANLIPP